MTEDYDDVQGFDIPGVPEPNGEESFFVDGIKDTSQDTSENLSENETQSNNDESTQTFLEEQTEEAYEEEPEEAEIKSIYDDLPEKETVFEDEDSESSIEKQINEAIPTEKYEAPPTKPQRKNEAKMLNRPKIFAIAGVLCAVFVIIFIVLPNFSKKEVVANEELDKANSTYFPDQLEKLTQSPKEESTKQTEIAEYKQIEIDIPQEDVKTEEDFSAMFPPPGESVSSTTQQKTTTETKTTVRTTVIETARNEQQKDLTRKALPDLTPGGTRTSNTGTISTTPTTYGGNGNSYVPQSLQNMQQINDLIASQNYGQNSSNSSSYSLQNNQSNKQEFFDSSSNNTNAGNYQFNSKYAIFKGTIITAVLDTAINTDLPGNVTAHVTKNVYSSLDGQYLIIPQGSIVFGEYNSTITYGQERVQVVWNTIIRPDGVEIDLGRMNGVDKYGYSGYEGDVSNHPFEYLKALGLISAYSVLDTKMTILQDQQQNRYAENVMSDVYAETQRLNNEVLRRALDIQPTITIPAKSVINIVTNVTMELPPLEAYEVTEKYTR